MKYYVFTIKDTRNISVISRDFGEAKHCVESLIHGKLLDYTVNEFESEEAYNEYKNRCN